MLNKSGCISGVGMKNIFSCKYSSLVKIPGTRIMRTFLTSLCIPLFCATAALADTTYVKPGDTGVITWPITGEQDSISTITGVRVIADASTCFSDTTQSQRQAIAVTAGQTQNIQIGYKIADDAQDGPCNAILRLTMDQSNVAATIRVSTIDFTGTTLLPPSVVLWITLARDA